MTSVEMRLMVITASLDYRLDTREGLPLAEFTWAGDDDGSPISGRGWARPTAEGLVGKLFIHESDEGTFRAVKTASR